MYVCMCIYIKIYIYIMDLMFGLKFDTLPTSDVDCCQKSV